MDATAVDALLGYHQQIVYGRHGLALQTEDPIIKSKVELCHSMHGLTLCLTRCS